MPAQNLVSAKLSPELKAAVMEKITGINADLNFVISILAGEKNEYIKVGNVMLPFLDKAHNIATAHPEILPGVFDKEEYEIDYQLTKDLIPIAAGIAELNSSIQATLFAANSDTMVESLEVYAAAQQNQHKVSGLEVEVAEMKSFFKRSRKTKTEEKPQ